MLKDLCLLNGTSGDESAVRDYIISKIKDNCEYKVDALGSIIAFKKGKKRTNKKVMICAHMDEVGFIITDITDDGYLKFAPVGGIDARIVADRKVTINNINGVIGLKPIHLLSSDEKEKAVSFKNLFIDIGARISRMPKNLFLWATLRIFRVIIMSLAKALLKQKHLTIESAVCL